MANWIALLTALIALVAALIALFQTLGLGRKVNTVELSIESVEGGVRNVEQQLKDVVNCWNEAEINIRQPEAEDRVSFNVIAWGEASVHPHCRYVNVFVRDLSMAGPTWRLTDVIQTDRTGRWSGVARLDHVPIGEKAEISVRLTARSIYGPIPRFIEKFPREGAPSKTVRVWRIK